MISVADYIIKFLKSKKVYDVFLITGGAISFVVDAFSRQSKVKYTCVAHEQAAAMMADSYSRLGPNFSATMVTSGPGATNLITGIACSWFDSIPSLHISGQVNSYELNTHHNSTLKVRQVGFQETDIVSMIKPITKFAYQLKKPSEIRYILEKAFYMSQEGRPGPVLVDIPMNFQRVKINPKKLKRFQNPKNINIKKTLILKKIFKIIDLLKKSNRPVIILGGGIRLSKSIDKLKLFLKFFQIPIVTTWSGCDSIDHNFKNYIGNIGVYGSRAANFTIQNSDLVLSLGSRLDTRITGGVPKNFARESKFISIDIDKYELNKKRGLKIDLKINLDLKLFFNFFIKINGKKKYIRENWLKQTSYWKKKYPVVLEAYRKQKKYVNPYYFMEILSKFMSNDEIIITDDGAHLTWTMQSLKIIKNQRLFSAFGNSPMGYAFPAAIGASIVKNKKRIICIDGDGSIQINLQELQTLKEKNLPVKIFIMNNSGYGIIKQFQELYLNKRYEASGKGVTNPDFEKVSKAFGINYEKICNNYQIDKIIKKVLNSNCPEFIDVFINPSQKIIPKLAFGDPIEDLSPKLSRKEFFENMIVPVLKNNKTIQEIN